MFADLSEPAVRGLKLMMQQLNIKHKWKFEPFFI